MILWTLRSAMRSLKDHKMRTALTTLGIVIGVAAMIIVMSLGHGAKERVRDQIGQLGTNFIIALARQPKQHSIRATRLFRQKTYDAILREVKQITRASPLSMYIAPVSFLGKSETTQLYGCYPEFLDIRDWKVAEGRNFTEREERHGAKVVILGAETKRKLFGNENAIGQIIRIKRVPLRVIGVLEEKGTSPDGRNQDESIHLPLRTLQRKISGMGDRFEAMVFSVADESLFNRVADGIAATIRRVRKIKDQKDDDFTVFTQKDVADVVDATFAILNMLLAAVASVALVVGGIGIMNIMLVTVTERTREIGIRMAIGAARGQLLSPFLLELVMICLGGGIVGVFVGIGAAFAISRAFGWSFAVSLLVLLISLLAATGIGVFFGYYPALRASRLRPSEAILEH